MKKVVYLTTVNGSSKSIYCDVVVISTCTVINIYFNGCVVHSNDSQRNCLKIMQSYMVCAEESKTNLYVNKH